jgi:ABC-type multidrug transport system ATPase subunit/ABC-type transporter Mla maintaining outer membrane lipid asymmetry permease subunit MlaE
VTVVSSRAPFLSVINLTVAPPGRPSLVENTSFQIGRGELVLLIGPSGSGKTSIVNLLCGLLGGGADDQAGWRIAGNLACGPRRIDLTRETSDLCGLVFQGNALFDDLSVAENVRIAADHAPQRDPALADAVLALLPDIDPRASVASCSGGQRQRIAIARTLMSDRPILVLDEPNSGLDIKASRRLAGLVKDICRESGKPAVIVAHHVEDLLPLADRVLLVDPHRRIVRQLPPDMSVIEAEMLAIEMPAGEGGGIDGVSSWRRRLGRRRQLVWFARYFAEYFWVLCLSPFMLAYLGLGGVILGFVSIWFGFNYHSFGGYLKSILHDETLAGLGFVQTTVAVPLIAAILVMARNSAIIAADLSNRVLSSQFRAMGNLRIPMRRYIVLSIVLNNLVALFLLTVVALIANSWASLQTWLFFFPEQPVEFWRENYFRRLVESGPHLWTELGWIVAKIVLAGVVGSAAAILIGLRRKTSVVSINNAIAEAIVVGVSVTLLSHAAIAVMQFWG